MAQSEQVAICSLYLHASIYSKLIVYLLTYDILLSEALGPPRYSG